jgi:hypothetical protein
MARLRPLGDGFDPALELPLAGADGKTRIYRVEPPAADLGLWARRNVHLGVKYREALDCGDNDGAERVAVQIAADRTPPGVDEDSDVDPETVFLGAAFTAMVADGVAWPLVQLASRTAMIWISSGDDAAAEFWQAAGGSPEAPGPANRAERRKTTRSTAAASTTKRPASTNGTSSRTTSSRAKPASRSRGARS